jgi:D-sedoheptulose 7-phosphate isomerase
MSRDWIDAVAEHSDLVAALSAVLASQLDPAISMLAYALVEGHKILTCGNGGSAGDASHLATELCVRYVKDRKAHPALSLAADAGILTAAANDYGYQAVFARQVEAYGRPGDVLVAFSTSGRSKNVLEAIGRAKLAGLGTLGICGAHPLSCDVDICIPSTSTARIQECTLLVLHLIVEALEERLPP